MVSTNTMSYIIDFRNERFKERLLIVIDDIIERASKGMVAKSKRFGIGCHYWGDVVLEVEWVPSPVKETPNKVKETLVEGGGDMAGIITDPQWIVNCFRDSEEVPK